jgi:hypothetical protein
VLDAQNNALFVWRTRMRQTKKLAVHARLLSPDARSTGPVDSARISDDGQHAMAPRVAVTTPGNAIVLWRRFDGASWRIQAAPLEYSTEAALAQD